MSSTINALTSGGGLAITGDTSGQLELKTNNGTTAVTVDTNQNLMVNSTTLFDPNGYASSGGKFLQVKGTTTDRGAFVNILGGGGGSPNYWVGGINYAISGQTYPAATIFSYTGASSTSGILGFTTSSDTTSPPTERMRITSAGDVVMGGGTSYDYSVAGFGVSGSGSYTYATRSGGYAFLVNRKTSTGALQSFTYNGSGVGDVSTNGSNCTFNSTSDYRLKQNIQPMTGALAKVALLNPVTYNWIRENQAGEGFIAHELQEVVPEAVTGIKDEVDEEGNPVYQAIDQSVLVATLTSAIQELNAKVDAQAAEIAALKGA